MNKSQAIINSIIKLPNLGILKVSGNRAKELLQGQLTCNLDDITPSQTKLAAHCNPQGRIISFFRILNHQNDYYLLMQKDLVPIALTALKKYAVFFKVELENITDQFMIIGYHGNQLEQSIQPVPKTINEVVDTNDTFIIKTFDQCYEIIGKQDRVSTCWEQLAKNNSIKTEPFWKYLSITHGIPAIYPETTEKFLPHDLNLHQLNAISFTKGCYTGQEIIARMQYKGKLKNRPIVVSLQSENEPRLGQDIYSDNGIAGNIVDYCQTEYNNYQMLIITNEESHLYLDAFKKYSFKKNGYTLMSTQLRIVLAQLNLFVGDIQGNLKKLIQAANKARDTLHADVIVFPELSITGYPPEDLLLRKDFIQQAEIALDEFRSTVHEIYCVIGHPYATSDGLFNACSLIYNGKILGHYKKQHLPNYGVFDECRYFISDNASCIVPIKGIPVGLMICEDLWYDTPIEKAAREGARIILSPNASPFEMEKHEQRQLTLAKRSTLDNLPIVYVNNVGGQDELIFDGGSMVVNSDGKICQHAGFFNETLMPVDFDFFDTEIKIQSNAFEIPGIDERIYQALVMAVRDYVTHNHFKGAIVGVSGGIDSALTLAIAVDALGKDNVSAILLPSRYTAAMSNEDVIILANNLGVKYEIISIEPSFISFLDCLKPVFTGKETDVTEENLQSRCRGVILMAISNKTGRMVLTTGNRSEMATGYATLYGDMAGGFAVLKDVPKTLVYKLSRYRNQLNPVIPSRIIERPPTAELAPDQFDENSLAPYPILDRILYLYLNEQKSLDEIVEEGFSREIVLKIIRLIHKNEYKRRQSPIGARIDHKAFGRDRRYPVSSGFKG